MGDGHRRVSGRDPLYEWDVQVRLCRLKPHTVAGSAVLEQDDNVLCNVCESAGEVTTVCGTQRRVSQSLAGAVSRDEVLEHRQTLTEE